MKIYLVMIENDDHDYGGTVVFTHTSKEEAISWGERLYKIHRTPTWVDEWPTLSTQTYDHVKTVWAVG